MFTTYYSRVGRVGECHKSSRITQSRLESLTQPWPGQRRHNGYYSINLFLSEQPNTRWWRPETAVATCHMSLCHYVRYINNGHHQDGLAWRPVQSQGVLTSLSLILLYGYVMYIFDFEIILCRAHLLTDKNIL